MNYKEHYDILIERARNRTLDGYKESHHVIPKCMNGTDEKSNLVNLTAREHFIAHLLLMKIYPKSYSLIFAVNMMCIHVTENRSMNRMYGWLKEKFSSGMSRSQSGESNSQYGKIWIHSLELKENKKILKGDLIPDGWMKGRVMDFEEKRKKQQEKLDTINTKKENKEKKQNKIKELKIKKEEDAAAKKEEIINLYGKFITSQCVSLSEFKRKENIIFSVMTLSNYFRKYIEEYRVNSKEGTSYRVIYDKLMVE